MKKIFALLLSVILLLLSACKTSGSAISHSSLASVSDPGSPPSLIGAWTTGCLADWSGGYMTTYTFNDDGTYLDDYYNFSDKDCKNLSKTYVRQGTYQLLVDQHANDGSYVLEFTNTTTNIWTGSNKTTQSPDGVIDQLVKRQNDQLIFGGVSDTMTTGMRSPSVPYNKDLMAPTLIGTWSNGCNGDPHSWGQGGSGWMMTYTFNSDGTYLDSYYTYTDTTCQNPLTSYMRAGTYKLLVDQRASDGSYTLEFTNTSYNIVTGGNTTNKAPEGVQDRLVKGQNNQLFFGGLSDTMTTGMKNPSIPYNQQ